VRLNIPLHCSSSRIYAFNFPIQFDLGCELVLYGLWSCYTQFIQGFYRGGMLNFIKLFSCLCWKDHTTFSCFKCIEPSLYPWKESISPSFSCSTDFDFPVLYLELFYLCLSGILVYSFLFSLCPCLVWVFSCVWFGSGGELTGWV
jgi:hypothetical protein